MIEVLARDSLKGTQFESANWLKFIQMRSIFPKSGIQTIMAHAINPLATRSAHFTPFLVLFGGSNLTSKAENLCKRWRLNHFETSNLSKFDSQILKFEVKGINLMCPKKTEIQQRSARFNSLWCWKFERALWTGSLTLRLFELNYSSMRIFFIIAGLCRTAFKRFASETDWNSKRFAHELKERLFRGVKSESALHH